MQLVDESWRGCMAVIINLFRGDVGTDAFGLNLTKSGWSGVYSFLDKNNVQGDGGHMENVLVRFIQVMA